MTWGGRRQWGTFTKIVSSTAVNIADGIAYDYMALLLVPRGAAQSKVEFQKNFWNIILPAAVEY